MGENSHISWTDHTFNPWIGCMKVGPACDGCYAEQLMGMTGRYKRVVWGGPGVGVGTRVRTVPSTWAKPLKWEREAAAAQGAPTFVFCSSLADVFDNQVPTDWLRDLFELIRKTPHLTWLLLTKRPQNIVDLAAMALSPNPGAPVQVAADMWPRNAAIGCTVVNQKEADRDVPILLKAKAALNPAFAFLSMEPLLGPVDLRSWLPGDDDGCVGCDDGEGLGRNRCSYRDIPREEQCPRNFSVYDYPEGPKDQDGVPEWIAEHRLVVDWVITGGETDQGAHKARPGSIQWYRELRDQCAEAGVPFHFKQWGEWQPAMLRPSETPGQFAFGDYDHDRTAMHLTDSYPRQFTRFGAHSMLERLGKHVDPCTLDGVRHDARPEVRA